MIQVNNNLLNLFGDKALTVSAGRVGFLPKINLTANPLAAADQPLTGKTKLFSLSRRVTFTNLANLALTRMSVIPLRIARMSSILMAIIVHLLF
tara:strand:- start:819 stop:1100 length:282 start_codon:yes stop_codon:yes gene_type:complete